MDLPCALLTLFVIAAVASTSTAATSPGFNCSSNSKCRALIEYYAPNATTLSSIQTLFQITSLRTLLGANDLPQDTDSNYSITASRKIIIPFSCACKNGTGISDQHPIYRVQPGDGLDHIAVDFFSRLVTYQQIQAVNNISDPNKILAGQDLLIPLPCSCDEVEGRGVVHYGHVVVPQSSIETIARDYNVSEKIIMEVNGIANASDLQAGQVLDLPLPACTSSVKISSPDYPLLVSNGTYIDTANGCVTCTCKAKSDWTLSCESSLNSSTSSCSAKQCEVTFSNTTSHLEPMGSLVWYNNDCDKATCAYAGYSTKEVLTTPVITQYCTEKSASSIIKEGLGRKIVFTCIYLLVLLLLVKK